MMSIDFHTKTEIQVSIKRIGELLSSGIFLPQNKENVFVKSAFIETMVCLRDLMKKTENYSERVCFDDDIVKIDNINDVTDSIKYIRDTLCHIHTDKHYIKNEEMKAPYNVVYGKKRLLKYGNFEQTSDYDDDVCFFCGKQKIYLNRHIIRAFEEAKQKLLPLLD